MGERNREGEANCLMCHFCGADISIAFHLDQGDLVYCMECTEAYVISSRYPPKLLPQAMRQMETPWQDGFYFA